MALTPLASSVMVRLERNYMAASDPARAASMAACMRDKCAFLGIAASTPRELDRAVLDRPPQPGDPRLPADTLACWSREEREYQYFAARLLRRDIGRTGAGFIDTVRRLVTAKSWWNTVDELAIHVVGPLVTRYPGLVSVMDAWAAEDDVWLIRT